MTEIHGETRSVADLVQLKLRFQERTRAKLEAAAKENGTSLNSEIVRRLEESLAQDERSGGLRNRRLFNALGIAIAEIENLTGHPWTNDTATFAAVRRALLDEVSTQAPNPVNETAIVAALEHRLGTLQAMTAVQQLIENIRNPGRLKATWDALGLDPPKQRNPLAAIEELELQLANLEHQAEIARQREYEALQPQRDAERRGRAVHRQWRKARRLKQEATPYGA